MKYQTLLLVPVRILSAGARAADRAYELYVAINRISRATCRPADYDEVIGYLSRKENAGIAVDGHGFHVAVSVGDVGSIIIRARAGNEPFTDELVYTDYRLRLVERIGLEEGFSITIPSKECGIVLDRGIFSAACDRANYLLIEVAP